MFVYPFFFASKQNLYANYYFIPRGHELDWIGNIMEQEQQHEHSGNDWAS
jgi:hypothetical protein